MITTANLAVTSFKFNAIFAGKSNNTSGFLLTVMKHAGLAKPLADSVCCYEFQDTTEFNTEMDALIAALHELVMAEAIIAPISKKLPGHGNCRQPRKLQPHPPAPIASNSRAHPVHVCGHRIADLYPSKPATRENAARWQSRALGIDRSQVFLQ